MLQVKNRTCIRRLSLKTMQASKKRNFIATIAIVLTTLLFTSLFTIAMSINTSYQTYAFRQIGGYNHGSFKEVTKEQAALIAEHKLVKETGIRKNIGRYEEGGFTRTPAEISYMDKNCTKWSYAMPVNGRMPQTGKEISMDITALKLLGKEPRIGEEITLSYTVDDGTPAGFVKTDTFTLVGYWEYDSISPVHYINVSEEYADAIESEALERGMEAFRTDLNVMMKSAVNIQGQMEQVDRDLGYSWERSRDGELVRIGVNWGYTTAQLESGLDGTIVLAVGAFVLLIVFSGYLIIYNVFQISVEGDIRFYGLLKAIGVTPTQLRRIIRQQALILSVIGIPVGLLTGYLVGAVLIPVVMKNTTLGSVSATLSTSPWIFMVSALFALGTVLLSCSRPGRMAAKVSPIEAAKYTEVIQTKAKKRINRGAKVYQMAFANLGRNKKKTSLVLLSLAFSVGLFNILLTFVNGFDMETYLRKQTCADFIVSNAGYFQAKINMDEYISEAIIAEIDNNTLQSMAGCGYTLPNYLPQCWIKENQLREIIQNVYHFKQEEVDEMFARKERRGDALSENALVEGLDNTLWDKVTVLEGDLATVLAADSDSIALVVPVDDYGQPKNIGLLPVLNEELIITYVSEAYYIDKRTGEKCNENTPQEYLEWYLAKSKDVTCKVGAYVTGPSSMSHRYGMFGYEIIMPVEKLEKDSGQKAIPMFYLFDTPDSVAEAEAENYLAELTKDETLGLMYESKAMLREDFNGFRNMFLLLGGVLCGIIAMIGILNYVNAIMTGILSRKKEFAVLQAVGMTNRQLRAMLIYEGMFYTVGAAMVTLILAVILNPLLGKLLENMFWFFNARFSITAILLLVPVFFLLGWLVPSVMYGQAMKYSVVERLREVE